MTTDAPGLRRTLSLPMLTLYGLGTMVGGGIYALVGKVAGTAGMLAPLAFVISAVIAGLSALSFCELSARYPTSAGESRYVLEAFGNERAAAITGWLVMLTGVVSAATLARAFGGFLQELAPIAPALGTVLCVAMLTGIAIWGIGESVMVATVITVIEVAGLFYVVWATRSGLATLPYRLDELIPADVTGWTNAGIGGFLAFYAFVGFEDMVNLAEEVKDVRRTMPLAIITALVVTTVLYVLIATSAVLTLDAETLTTSAAPLSDMVRSYSAVGATWMTVAGLLSGINGALMQVVMAPRVAYGMARRGLAPAFLGKVNAQTQTPITATLIVGGVVLTLALGAPLESLARWTAGILLFVFFLVNVSLVAIQRALPDPGPEIPRVPRIAPVLGAVLCLGFLAFQGWATLAA